MARQHKVKKKHKNTERATLLPGVNLTVHSSLTDITYKITLPTSCLFVVTQAHVASKQYIETSGKSNIKCALQF